MSARAFALVFLLAGALAGAHDVHVSQAEAPAGLQALPVEWLKIETGSSGTLIAAVARPKGKGPFPVRSSFTGAMGSPVNTWSSNRLPASTTDADRTECRGARGSRGPRGGRASVAGRAPGSRRALRPFTGGGATINYLEHGGDVRAAILNSSGYSDEYIENAAKIHASILILHGVKDTNGEMTVFARAQRFTDALRAAGVPMEMRFYPDGEHRGVFIDRRQHDDEVRRGVEFLRKTLR